MGLLPSTIDGLPLHPLVVHATVVVVPLAAVTVALAAVLPRFRRWAGWLPLLLALGAVVLTPLSTSTGEDLESRQGSSAAIARHAELGGQLLWFVVPLLVVAFAAYFLGRRDSRGTERRSVAPRWAVVGLTVVSVVVALGVIVEVVRIGHSGATAVWNPPQG